MSSIKRKILKRSTSTFFIIFIFFLILMTISVAYAGEAAKYKPLPVKKQKPYVWHLIAIDSINLSAADFYEAWTGGLDDDPGYITYSTRLGEPGDPKDKANLYLLGVLDATEGKTWCGYDDSFDIKVAREKVADHFKTIPEKILATKRASDVIETALKKNFPACKAGHTATPPTSRGTITPDSVNMSGEDFITLYMSKDDNKSHDASFYLLGVLDATEGKLWCNYWTFKIITLRETIFSYLDKFPRDKLKTVRATAIIEEALRRYPCKRNK